MAVDKRKLRAILNAAVVGYSRLMDAVEEATVAALNAYRARQTFSKSAQQAQFIDSETGRFIKPGNLTPPEKADEALPKDEIPEGGGNGGGGNLPPDVDPIIKGLIDRLPAAGTVWPTPKRKLWLQILENSFELVYGDGDRNATTTSASGENAN